MLLLEWEWVDFANKRVVWPDSKTGGMSKPLSAEALRLLRGAPRYARSKFVIPALFDGSQPMTKNTYWDGWKRILERAGLPHCGTHAVRHRAATDIANSGVAVKVGMALTAHKTVTMFMRYVHTEDDPIRAAAETVAARRRSVLTGAPNQESAIEEVAASTAESLALIKRQRPASPRVPVRQGPTKTAMGKHRPYRGRRDEDRAAPPKPSARPSHVEEVQHV